jgi:SAM-dependent methyltransferase
MTPPPSRQAGQGVGSRWRNRRPALRDPAIVERILENHAARPNLRPILDAPCGTGRLRSVFERRGMRYVGVDVSVPMLEEARRGEGTGLVLAVVDRMPFKDDAFDMVLCCRLLHHLEENEETEIVVKELVRVAHRLIVVSFWDKASLPALRSRVALKKPEGPRGRRMLSKRALKKMFEEAGAEIVGFHHSLRFVSQQAFAVAIKRARVEEPVREAESLAKQLLGAPAVPGIGGAS